MIGKTRGLTLIELLVVVNIVAILAGAGSILYAEYGSEARCSEIYTTLPQIIRSQGIYFIQHNQYYTATHDQMGNHGIGLSGAQYFVYSTRPAEGSSSFIVQADATDWAPGDQVIFELKGIPRWKTGDGNKVIKREWLPE